MCGIAGFLFREKLGDHQVARDLGAMTNAITRRGPDSQGAWFDTEAGVALGHRRLAIVDLSAAGHQPMMSPCGRYVISYNGEIYNHAEIRADIEKHAGHVSWRGLSDTETLLSAIVLYGMSAAVSRCVGMFAIALWDRQTKTLTLARDRLGEKPLYYSASSAGNGPTMIFGSDLHALRAHPSFKPQISRDSLCLFMRHGYIPAPHTIFKDVHKIDPGTILEFSSATGQCTTSTYWTPNTIFSGLANAGSSSPTYFVDELERRLTTAIGQQMVADVPLGAFLSGGIDSSTVVALMQTQSARPIRTFSIGFDEAGYNEAVHAKAVATHLGTDHTELYVRASDALDVVPTLSDMYSEPFADSSQIPTHLVSQLARRSVTVSLSGDGGDELFSGYSRYDVASRVWSRLSLVPPQVRRLTAALILSVRPATIGSLSRPFLPRRMRGVNVGDRAHKLAALIGTQSFRYFYRQLVSAWEAPADVVIGGREPDTWLTRPDLNTENLSLRQIMSLQDMLTYLPDDILAKVDRAAMYSSLETRVPFLDHRVVEFSAQIPDDVKQRENRSKWVLRQVLYRHVPKHLIERPKMGFGVPIDAWLRGPLRAWADDLLDRQQLVEDGFFDPDVVTRRWQEHTIGIRNWHHQLWNVLMFQAWLRNWRQPIERNANA